ncbi:MAG: DUF6159 family protein [Ilumatobacter sp.]|uniref:DUF6159 family protein n=1 Tax=Ilumatobacter sp. TaxID=1967498 RepID=UPI002607DBF4|nr:DUF6159 family protein [Ilumatobacter sp.]MDJ0771397.1 DUF6159 family protein [Ilumatobacter sp.]
MFQRIRQGWELTKKAWSVVRSNPRLARLPLVGGILALVAFVLLGGPGIFLASGDADATTYVGYGLIAAGSYLASFIVIYYNVILAAAANDALEGREPDLAAARGIARHRIPQIAGWALVSALVSIAFSILRDRGGTAGRIAAGLGSAIWGLVTFLVIPVVALEGIGPIAAIKRSANLFKRRWGQQVTGNLVIGGISTVVMIVGAVIAGLGVYALATGSVGGTALGAVLIVAGIVIAVAAAVFAGATRGVFGVALYHFVAEDRAIGPFTVRDLESAATTR